MNFSKFIYLCFLLFLYTSIILSQSLDREVVPKLEQTTINDQLQTLVPQDWNLEFSYNLFDILGSNRYAGVLYESTWDELWISSWATGTIEILQLSDTALTPVYDAEPEGVSEVRGLTTDGEFVYAGNSSDTIKIMNFYFEPIGEIISPVEVRYITFVPDADEGKGGFWVGNWTTDPTLIDKNGNFLRSLDYTTIGTEYIYGGAYDHYSSDGPFLWLWGRGDGGGNPQNIIQVNPSTGLPTGVYKDVTLDVGDLSDSLICGGLFITNELFNDKIILGGILQGSGDYLFGYDISSSITINFPPTAYTDSAASITSNSATLYGRFNPNGPTTNYSFELGTSDNYGTTIFGTSSYAGYMDFSVSSEATDLLPNTTYHYRLRAYSSEGTSYGEDKTFTTSSTTIQSPLVTTTAATNVSSNSARLNALVNPNGNSTTYYFEYGTSTNYGSTAVKTDELNGTSDYAVFYDLNNLQPNTTYHYRISATNSDGTSKGNDISFLTNSVMSNVDLEWRTLSITSFDWDIGSTLSASLMVRNNGSTPSDPHESQLYLSSNNTIESTDIELGNRISFPSIAANDSTTVSTSFTVPSVSDGVYYLGAIVDINNSITETNESNNNYSRNGKIIIGYPDNIQISTTSNFNDPALSSSFKMIGIPGDVSLPISQLINGTYNEDWVAYYDNGNATNYLVSYDGSNIFNFVPGKGFWILSKNNININQNANAVTIESRYTSLGSYEMVYPIDLHNGWNIISNPFDRDVEWNTVQSYNQINESLHEFNGSFSSSSTLEPYNGYYFYNATNLQSLLIPYYSFSSLSKEIVENNFSDNYLILNLTNDIEQNSNLVIGVNENASTSYDKFDRFIPPGDFDELRIYSNNDKLETTYKYLANDFREVGENHRFNIVLKNKSNENPVLNISGVNSIPKGAIYLVNNNLEFHNLRLTEKVNLELTKEVTNLTLLIGDENYIELNRDLITPKEFSLKQNYPNPFNPTTTIEFTVPKISNIEIKLFDVLGKEIKTIISEEKSPGKYEIIFNGSGLTSGIYFYRYQAANYSETRKMILIK